jgi:AcrR family transcriptional regulator
MDTREQILSAAVRVFAEVGSRGATTRRIAEAAGVNEVTLFRHFGSKGALLAEALEWSARGLTLSTLPTEPVNPAGELTAWSEEHLRALFGARSLLRTSMGEYEVNEAARRLACTAPTRAAGELGAYLERLQERGLCRRDLNVPAATALLTGALFSDAMSRDVMPERFPFDLDAAARSYVGLFLRAIAPDPPGTAREDPDTAGRAGGNAAARVRPQSRESGTGDQG